ncbi:MAG: NAD-dependent succinate-semialdehyde dehydrogenase [Nevskiaceae bacterium]|nr:MAG: NAD-dependent succinate-semialdehyde dehydrogenase [Nevskiaceae bacterium]TBR74468.1 MAG: NAD-dependent succinate-semialdehyde dehydrogenase [Nevskiaceae bacterium]
MNLESINPATGARIRSWEGMSDATAAAVLQCVAHAQTGWHATPFDVRAKYLRAVGQALRAQAPELGRLMAQEMGKPLAAGAAEAEKCAWVCDYYADNAARQLARQVVQTDAQSSFVCFQPLGVVLAIMPWNYPLWQAFRCAAPALMAGNAAVLKHAPNVTGCGLAIEALFQHAGLPRDVFRTLVIGNEQCRAVIENPVVNAVSLTGSVRAGRAVAAQAGAVLKKCVLELGGSDPYVVLEDADLDLAARVCVAGRFTNSGQSCIAAKRWIVVEAVREAFQRRVVALIGREKVGDPCAPETTIGPMARLDLRDALHAQVRVSVAKGATCVLGGTLPPGPGAFYPPTLLTDVRPGMPAYSEELFGPVAAIIAAQDEADAVRIANDTTFGLGGAVFTRNRARGERLAAEAIQSGAVFVNQQVKSDPRLPFGGIRDSGYGRELGPFGIREFVNVKTVSVA